MAQFATLEEAEKAYAELVAKAEVLARTADIDRLDWAADYVTEDGRHCKMLLVHPKGKRPFKMSEGKFLTLLDNAIGWIELYNKLSQ